MWLWAAGEHERAREMAMLMTKSDKLTKEEKIDKMDLDDSDKLIKLRASVGTMVLDSKEAQKKIDAEVRM